MKYELLIYKNYINKIIFHSTIINVSKKLNAGNFQKLSVANRHLFNYGVEVFCRTYTSVSVDRRASAQLTCSNSTN